MPPAAARGSSELDLRQVVLLRGERTASIMTFNLLLDGIAIQGFKHPSKVLKSRASHEHSHMGGTGLKDLMTSKPID